MVLALAKKILAFWVNGTRVERVVIVINSRVLLGLLYYFSKKLKAVYSKYRENIGYV